MKPYTEYVKIVILIIRTFSYFVWTEVELEELSQDIIIFQTSTFGTFTMYQVFWLGTWE